MIKVEGLTKYYGQIRGIEDVTFTIKEGEIVGLLGPNGAGKTTTMRILTCLFPPTRGKAEIAGLNILENPIEVKKLIGYLPETTPLYLDMSVLSYLMFVAEMKGIKRKDRKRKVEEVVEVCGIENVKRRLIGKLSKGYKQRVGLAQALLGNPPVLILDEPTIGLDPKQTFEFRQLIKDMQGKRTIILSTHILPEVSMTCQRVIIINKGKIIAQDTPDNLAFQLQKSYKICAKIEGPPEKIVERLKDIEGIKDIKVEKKIDDKKFEYVINAENLNIAKDIASCTVKSGWGLFEIRPLSMGLEDIFVNLVTEEKTE